MQFLNYLQSTEGIIWVIACIPVGFLLTALAYFVINKVPAKWLCDYNETPSEELLNGKRVFYKKSGIIVSVVMSLALAMCRMQFGNGQDIYFILMAVIMFFAVMIAASDFKYTIIPDQFTIAIGIAGLALSTYDILSGNKILHGNWWSPIVGALIGSVVMIIIDLLGMLIYKQDGMGFGDVKLFFAVGLFTGFPGTIYALIISIITAAICFVVVILISSGKSGSGSDTDSNEMAESPSDIKDENTENSESDTQEDSTEETDDSDGEVSGGSQLAFGPYIAIAVIAYSALYNIINYLVGLYINLF
ncbi:MAG: A24 family peptidase [Clostridia bacterium]|nr:A24 family peptidase [Clostridia bacterium]